MRQTNLQSEYVKEQNDIKCNYMGNVFSVFVAKVWKNSKKLLISLYSFLSSVSIHFHQLQSKKNLIEQGVGDYFNNVDNGGQIN